MVLSLVCVLSNVGNVSHGVELIDEIRDDVQIQVSDVFRDIVNNQVPFNFTHPRNLHLNLLQYWDRASKSMDTILEMDQHQFRLHCDSVGKSYPEFNRSQELDPFQRNQDYSKVLLMRQLLDRPNDVYGVRDDDFPAKLEKLVTLDTKFSDETPLLLRERLYFVDENLTQYTYPYSTITDNINLLDNFVSELINPDYVNIFIDMNFL